MEHLQLCLYHGFNDDGEVVSLRVIESDVAASRGQVARSIAMLQVIVAYLTELSGVGWEGSEQVTEHATVD